MADLALYTAQTNRARFGIRRENFIQSIELHRIAYAGAGAVGFHQAYFAGGIVQLFKRFFYGNFLPFRVRRGNTFAFPVGRSTNSADNGIHFIAVFHRITQAFQNNSTGTFGHDKAVRFGIKRTRTFFRQSTDFAELNISRRRHHLVHTAHDGHIKITFAQAVYGLVHRGQRSGTSGVYGEVGAMHIKHIGQAAGNHVG